MTTVARYNWTDADGIVHKNDIRWDPATGGLAMCSGLEAYRQIIESVVKTIRGEIESRLNYGIPYFSTIFDHRRYAPQWEVAVKNAVLALDFVKEISSFEYTFDARRKYLTYKMEVVTTDGGIVEVAED